MYPVLKIELFALPSGVKLRSLSLTPPSWRITEIPCHQYSQGTVHLQKITFWSYFCSYCFSAYYGQYITGSIRSMHIPRSHTGHQKNSIDEHIMNLNTLLTCLCVAGTRLKKAKCQFSLTKIEYLGHVISSKGLEPTTSKVTAIIDAPSPYNVSQLKWLLRFVNYYGKFLLNLSTTLAPLYRLLRQGVKWQWKPEEELHWQK